LAVDQGLDYVFNNLGYSYLLQGSLDLAIENFKKALNLDSGNARYRNNLGLAYAKKGQHEVAFAEFKQSGDEAKAHYNIAQLYYREGLYKEAEVHFAEAAALKPSDPDSSRGLKAAASLGEILAKSEKLTQKTNDTTVNKKRPGRQRLVKPVSMPSRPRPSQALKASG